MTETQKNIKELKESLPKIKEKVIAMATMLVLALTMIATTSYAWYTMSSSPEISSIMTTVSSNGSLEVALAGRYDAEGNLLEPGASGVDSFAAEGQTTVESNLTWGNLINLSTHYGIESLVLRPATFSDNSPAFLTSMKYADDGRVDMSTNKFDFTSWLDTEKGPAFVVPEYPLFGVRAISSVRFQETDMEAKINAASHFYDQAAENYERIVSDAGYLSAIKAVLQIFIDSNVPGSSGEASFTPEQIWSLYQMMDDLCENVFVNFGEALVGLANTKVPTAPYTLETFLAASAEELEAKGIDLSNSYSLFKSNYAIALKDRETLKTLAENAKNTNTNVPWSSTEDPKNDLESIVDRLVNTNSVNLMTSDGTALTLSDISGMGYSDLLSLAGSLPDPIPIVIHNGVLKDLERMTGKNMSAYLAGLKVLVLTKNCRVETDLRGTSYRTTFDLDRETIKSGGPVYTGKKEADTTYGMVIDLWVRTNAANSMLILDGIPEIVTYKALRKVIPSGTSESKQAFLYTYYTGNEISAAGQTVKETATIQLFQIPQDLDGDGTISSKTYKMELNKDEEVSITIYEGYFYDTTTHSLVRLRDASGDFVPVTDSDGNAVVDEEGNETYVYLTHEHFWDNATDIEVETYTYEVVTGFSSSNRIDEGYSSEAGAAFETSATQGSGSCYIFYASPEEADSTLALLSHLKLAFCDINGKKLADARLAVEYVFADSGKYVVPIVLEASGFTYEEENQTGKTETCYAITNLTQNEAMLISVVVYLDGKEVDNSMVMEKGTINGSLNLQFASTADLGSLGDTALSTKTISVKANASHGDQINTTNLNLEFDPDDLAATTITLKTEVIGTNPQSVQAIFRRQVNASQGTAMTPVTMNADMTGTVKFTMPGVYVLRSLWVDGAEYALPESSWITVNVAGFSVNDVSFCDAAGEELALTAENFVTRDVSILFNKGEQVNSVAVRFLDDNNQPLDVTLRSTNNADKWSGTARFRSSGHYTLTYVKVNGEFYEIPETMRKDLTAYLGLRAEVALQSVDPSVGLNFPFKGAEEFKIFAKIKTDTGEELKNLTDLTLSYTTRGGGNSISAPLTWKASGYYEGHFNVTSVGTYMYSSITIGASNAITEYNLAATISAYATNPPSYILQDTPVFDNGNGNQTADLLIMSDLENAVQNRGSYYVIRLRDAGGADSFTAVFVDAKGNPHEVVLENFDKNGVAANGMVQSLNDGSGDALYYFEIPSQNGAGNSNGDWYVKEIWVAGVYDGNGKYYGEKGENPVAPYYTLKATSGNLHAFSVIETVTTGLSSVEISNAFMTGTSLMDSKGNYMNTPVSWDTITHGGTVSIDSVVVTLKHNENSMSGYYSVDNYGKLSKYTTFSFPLTQNAADGKWYAPESAKAYVAGTYSYTMVVTLNTGDTFTTVSHATLLSVKTTLPTVQISGTSQGNSSVTTDTSSGGGHGTQTASWSPTSATVYIACNRSGSGSSCDPYRHNYSGKPTVTIKLTGKGAALDVTMTFGSGIRMYNGSTQTDSYSWTADGTAVRSFGDITNKTAQSDEKTGAGTLTSNALVLTFDGVAFTVTVPTITINNPY